MADKNSKPNPLNNFKITRTADESRLTTEEFAFIFDIDGNIRCVQLPLHLSDDDILPGDISKMIEIVSTMDLLAPKKVMH